MLAYAADQRPGGRKRSPTSLLLIIGGHAVALALVLTARMELITPERTPPTKVIDITQSPPPEPQPKHEPKPNDPVESTVTVPLPPMPLPPRPGPTLDPGPPQPPQPPISGSGTSTLPLPQPPIREMVRTGPRFATPDHALRPPYPLAKQREEEEAMLRLRLAIDSNGRVTAVDPVGRADPIFLEAARKHILRAWRYKPATEDGRAVASSTVISLAFRLENA
jgi:protein TonB